MWPVGLPPLFPSRQSPRSFPFPALGFLHRIHSAGVLPSGSCFGLRVRGSEARRSSPELRFCPNALRLRAIALRASANALRACTPEVRSCANEARSAAPEARCSGTEVRARRRELRASKNAAITPMRSSIESHPTANSRLPMASPARPRQSEPFPAAAPARRMHQRRLRGAVLILFLTFQNPSISGSAGVQTSPP